jgi:hypothetical protein
MRDLPLSTVRHSIDGPKPHYICHSTNSRWITQPAFKLLCYAFARLILITARFLRSQAPLFCLTAHLQVFRSGPIFFADFFASFVR